MHDATQKFGMVPSNKNGQAECDSGSGGGNSGSTAGGSQVPKGSGCCLKGDYFTYYNTASHMCCNNDVVEYGTC